MKYEVQLTFLPGYSFQSEIAMLTGLEVDEIIEVTKNITTWRGSTYIQIMQQLGYSTNPRFIKFDKETTYPCLMRTRKLGEKKYWYGWVYYDGFIYDTCFGKITWAEWNEKRPNFRITSMLQVWI